MCLSKITFMVSTNPEMQDSKDSVKEIQEHFIVFICISVISISFFFIQKKSNRIKLLITQQFFRVLLSAICLCAVSPVSTPGPISTNTWNLQFLQGDQILLATSKNYRLQKELQMTRMKEYNREQMRKANWRQNSKRRLFQGG